ncbi:MAG TPA: transposase, partial [Anaerolineales bacterium]
AAAAARVPAPAPVVPAPVRVEVVKESNVSRRWRTKVKPQSLQTLDSGNDLMNELFFKTAPHNPPHLFVSNTLYMLTASIYEQVHLIESPQRKAEWREAFHEAARIYGWQIIAWVVLHNHYHAIVQSPECAGNLSKFVNSYHKFTSRKWNCEDGLNGRKVWWNYWDTCIRSEHDYCSRLRYVFWNPLKHGLVERPDEYEFSNYSDYLNADAVFSRITEVNDVPEF